ncbi:hypothetical protein F0562_017999 [Nyssa sinensis]|uniref:Uncharacterized protein n=1 Tax=Nyssa sinensis TaxID=561372 RepID=A0A5J4Z8U0_9ASTE|nr:hypothetical protein F0562_017999 [Nyssa sinensis]
MYVSMAADVVSKHETMNPCCAVWKERYSKMKEQRTALRQGLNIYEQQIGKIEAENQNLKKAIPEEGLQADIEREKKQKGPQAQEMDREVLLLRTHVSERETEINRHKELLERENKGRF